MNKISNGLFIGYNDVLFISALLLCFFFTMTWGTKKQNDGILLDEELGKRIQEKSSSVSYQILALLIFFAVIGDAIINDTVNMFLLILLGIAIVIQPMISFIVAQSYQLEPNFLGRIANLLKQSNKKTLTKKQLILIGVSGILTGLFVFPKLFGSGIGYDLLVFLFGEPTENSSPFPLLFMGLIITVFITWGYFYMKSYYGTADSKNK